LILFLLSGLFLAGASVALVVRAITMSNVRTAETIGQIEAYGFSSSRDKEKQRSGGVRTTADAVASLVGGAVARRFGGLREDDLRNQLLAAGLYRTAPRKFLGYRIITTVSVPIAWFWAGMSSGFSPFLVLIGTLPALLVGWTAPLTIVRKRARRRVGQIDYDLPELIDLLIVTVEAGLGFNSSLQVAAERLHGPLGDELRLTLQQQSMGLSTTEALQNMLARADTPAMRSFVRSIVQGETLGVSIGDIMRNLATEMRKRRRAAAEERAQKAPIKILFPLVFMIFPAMFVVLLGPALFSFLAAIKGAQ
jgi:tight adherence protein C